MKNRWDSISTPLGSREEHRRTRETKKFFCHENFVCSNERRDETVFARDLLYPRRHKFFPVNSIRIKPRPSFTEIHGDSRCRANEGISLRHASVAINTIFARVPQKWKGLYTRTHCARGPGMARRPLTLFAGGRACVIDAAFIGRAHNFL